MKPFAILLLLALIFACEADRTNRNPYLQEIGFRFDLNLNLPLYSPLTNTGSAVYVDNASVGTRGIFVINTGFNQFRAFEASCPNHEPNTCSTMVLDGQVVTCPCEDYEYSLFTGQMLNRPNDGNRYYDMLEYRANFSGNVVIISN
jgi:nitrite reductase/ring-hydroxylating ferredoxin subunit